jgi:hypothetical protein
VNSTVKGRLIRLAKYIITLFVCVIQILFFVQVMPYGGVYIGILSLLLDLSIYCWVASGAHKAMTPPRARGKASPRQAVNARHLLLDQDL